MEKLPAAYPEYRLINPVNCPVCLAAIEIFFPKWKRKTEGAEEYFTRVAMAVIMIYFFPVAAQRIPAYK